MGRGTPQGESAIASRQFQFRLQTVLDVRERERDEIQLLVAREERKYRDIENTIEALTETIARTIDEHQAALELTGAVDPMMSRALSGYLGQLRYQRSGYEGLKNQQWTVLNGVREKLRVAQMKVKALELLKEKQATAHKVHLEKQEDLILGEMATQRAYARNLAEKRQQELKKQRESLAEPA